MRMTGLVQGAGSCGSQPVARHSAPRPRVGDLTRKSSIDRDKAVLNEPAHLLLKKPRQITQIESAATGRHFEIEHIRIGDGEMDPACGLSDEYIAFEGPPTEPLIKWRVARLTEQQTEGLRVQ